MGDMTGGLNTWFQAMLGAVVVMFFLVLGVWKGYELVMDATQKACICIRVSTENGENK